jgi:hypothetical protein
MLSWIWNNKDWLFAGVGLVIIGAAWRIIKSIRPKKNQPQPDRPNVFPQEKGYFDEGIYHSKPSPSAIINDLWEQPPLMRDEYKKTYINHKFQWKLEFQYAHWQKDQNNTASLTFREKGRYIDVDTTIDVNSFPEIRRRKTGTLAALAGTITKIDGINIIVVLDHITFLD